MKILSDSYWNRGMRISNEDSLTMQQVMTESGRILLAAVSDGIGGLPEGQNASGYILEQLVERFYTEIIPLLGRGKGKKTIRKSLQRCFYAMNQELNHYAGGRNITLGATISLLLIWKSSYMIFHLGDSRIYEYGKRGLRQLTEDHSDGGPGLTKCMGSFPYQPPDIRIGRSIGRRGFLLCTDGFYKLLSMKDIQEILSPSEITCEEQIGRRLKEIGELAMKQGSRDNLSAIYILQY